MKKRGRTTGPKSHVLTVAGLNHQPGLGKPRRMGPPKTGTVRLTHRVVGCPSARMSATPESTEVGEKVGPARPDPITSRRDAQAPASSSAMLAFPPEIVDKIVELLPHEANYRERGEGEDAAFDDQCLGFKHVTCSRL